MSTAGGDNGAENSNESDDVNATKSSSRAATPSVEAATATSRSRSRSRTPPVTVLPICCILDPEKGLFRVTRSKGKTLAAGGFGITISEPLRTAATTTPVDKDGDDDNGELDSHHNSESKIMEDARTLTPIPTPATSSTTTSQTPNTSNSYLFIEEVLFLHERGMIECYRYDDDDNKNNTNDSKLITSTENGDAGRQRLDSYQLYNMLEVSGGDSISLPIYLVYAYLLQQDYRVLRHFDNRRDILDAMEQEKSPTQVQHDDGDKDGKSNDQDTVGEDDDDDRDDDDEQKEDEEGEGENKGPITNDDSTDGVRRKRKRDKKAGLKALRLQLRREAAQAPPPILCNTSKNSNDDDGTDVSIAFDVYRPNSNFCKGAPGLPDFYVAGTHYNTSGGSGASLSFQQIQCLLAMSAGRSLKIATVSDAGAVIMFGITDHGVPAIQQGESNDSTTNRSD